MLGEKRENKWLDGRMDGELAGTKRGQGSDRRRGEEMRSEEEKEKKRTEES